MDFAGGNRSSDAGLLLLRRAERNLGICRRLAEAMPDWCDAGRHPARHVRNGDGAGLGHRMRLRGLLLTSTGCGMTRDDGRGGALPHSGAPLASQSTISRLENAPSKTEAARLTAALVDQAGKQ